MDDIDPSVIELFRNHPAVITNPDRLIELATEYSQSRPNTPIQPALPQLDELVGQPVRRGGDPEPSKTTPLSNVPEFMRSQRRWSVFRRSWNEERKKFDKVPCQPNGDTKLYPGYPNPENSRDFGDFESIRKLCELDTSFVPAYYLLKKDGIIFLDFDPPCDVPNFPTYTERSISGGYHCLGWYAEAAPKIPGVKEVYCDRRWIVVTGDIVRDKIYINDLTDVIIELNKEKGTTVPSIYNKFNTPKEIPSGERNNVMFRYAASMRAKGSSPEAIFAALAAENRIKCHPPLPDSEIKAIAASASKYPAGDPPRPVSPKTDITKKRIHAGPSSGEWAKIEQSLDAIVNVYNNPVPRVFVRGGKLSRVIYDENGTPSIDKLEEKSLSGILTQCIDWYLVNNIEVEKKINGELVKEKKQIEVLTVTPSQVIGRLYALGQWEGMSALQGIVESPYIVDDGSIITTPGYNQITKLYLAQQQNFKGITVPEHPTKEEILVAKKLLFDLFSEFHFESDADRENHIACLITAAIRPTIKGLVPLMVYDKPVIGAGASLLGELISGITTGRPASMVQAPDKNTEGEWNKLIIGLLREGRSINIFDNVEGDIYSAALAALLTASLYRGRVLGKNATEEYPNNALWICNGNNIQITHDLPRRCVWIRLATETARPYERTDWKIQNIREYVIEHQSEYLSAILTIVRGWCLAGKPTPDKKLQVMGSFEMWRDTLGGIMKFIGCIHFLENTSSNLDIAEEAHEEVEEFLQEIYLAFPPREQTLDKDGWLSSRSFAIKEITPVDDPVNYVKGNSSVRTDMMPGYLQEIQREHPKKLPHSIGNYFKKLIGRVFPLGYKLERVKNDGKVATYRISFKKPVGKDEGNV
jgi:hypothetical protein